MMTLFDVESHLKHAIDELNTIVEELWYYIRQTRQFEGEAEADFLIQVKFAKQADHVLEVVSRTWAEKTPEIEKLFALKATLEWILCLWPVVEVDSDAAEAAAIANRRREHERLMVLVDETGMAMVARNV